MTIVLLPKNRGLAGQLERVRDRCVIPSGIDLQVRGEDVPLFASELSRLGQRVLAFTGDDLLDEWLLAGNTLDEGLDRRRLAWSDPNALFGAPALCLLGTSHEVLRERRPLRIAVCTRYRELTQRFLAALRADGVVLDPLPISGSLETWLRSGVTDLAIDIVVTGETMRQANLRVLRVISTSDIAVLESRA